MSATVDTTDLSYGVGAVANSRPAVYADGSWHIIYAKSTGTYVNTSSNDGTSFGTAASLSGLAGRLIGAVAYQAVRDMAGNIMVAYPGNDQDGSWYMLWRTVGGAWDTSPSLIPTAMFGGVMAHLYEGASTYFRALDLYNTPVIYRTTTPSASTSTWANDQSFAIAAPGGGSGALLTQGSNVVALYYNSFRSAITFAELDLDTVPGSVEFPTTADAVTDASLDTQFAACVDGAGLIHVIYRIASSDWFEATYDGATWTTGGTVPQMADDDRSPALMCDGAGKLHLVYARYNAASDYGIGYISKTSAGSWTAQSDLVTHNATNRTSVTIADTTSSAATLVTWLEGGTTIKGQGLAVTALGINPVVATISRTAAGPSSVSFSISASGGTSPYTYQWYRSLDSGFTPDGTNDLSGETSTTLTDTPPDTQLYYYKCVATDNVAATDESNQLPGLLYNATLVLGFIGDSITSQTSGGGLSTCQAMGERLAIWAGMRTVTVVDQSAGGTSAGDWQPGDTHYDTASAAFTAAGVTHVMVMLGTNGLSTTPPFDQANIDSYLADIGTIAAQLVTDGFTVVLNAPPYISLDAYQIGDAYLQAMGAQLPTLADDVDVFMGDTAAYTWFGQHADELFDGVHPTVLGVQTLGSLWALAFRAAFLVALLALAPASDVSNAGSWTTNTGGTSNLYAAVDEGVPFNQTDYLQSPTNPSSSTVVLALGTSVAPATNADHTLRIQLKRG